MSIIPRAALLCFTLAIAPPVLADFDALSALAQSGARVSAAVVDLDSSKTIARLNAGTRLAPASTTKLLVAAKALEIWPANQTFTTRLYGTGPVKGGVLEGDLLLGGDSDPSLTHEQLITLAAQIRAAGITRITGNVQAVTAPFGPLPCETKDRCDALLNGYSAYNAPIAGIGVDYGAWCIQVQPTRPGQPAVLTGCKGIPLPIEVEGKVTTASNGRANWWVSRRSEGGNDRLVFGGTVAAGEAQVEYRAMRNPALGAALLMRQTLISLGTTVDGAAAVRSTGAASGNVLASVESMPLKDQLGQMLRYSNNYIADMLTLKIAANQGRAIGTLAEGSSVLAEFVANALGDPQNLPGIYSGSGLTPENLISASEFTAVLAAQYQNPRNFGAFYGGLTVPRQAAFKYIKNGTANWMDRVALKTGSMNDPRSVCAVAGFLRKQNGGFMAFAVLVNGGDSLKHVPLYKSVDAIKTDIDAILTAN